MDEFSASAVKISGVSFQPLVNKLAELSTLDTLVLLTVIVVLLFQNHSERKRNADAYANQVTQAASIVKVLTAHQLTIQNLDKSLVASSMAMTQLHSKVHDLATEVRCLNSSLKPTRSRRANNSSVEKGTAKS